MEDNRKNFFWTSYVDLMTALFAVVLVLFILSFKQFDDSRKKLLANADELKLIKEVKKNLEVLMSDTTFFKYEKKYKRYRLAQDIKFKLNECNLDKQSVENFEETNEQLLNTGEKLKNIIISLKDKKDSDTSMKEISYLMIISGRSSDLQGNDTTHNYNLSYERAYSLYNFWKPIIDFDDTTYQKFLDFQIAGNGIGGIGRVEKTYIAGKLDENEEMKNQTFLIQIIPKVGKIDSELSNSPEIK